MRCQGAPSALPCVAGAHRKNQGAQSLGGQNLFPKNDLGGIVGKKNGHLESAARQTLPQCRAATSWLRSNTSGESGASEAAGAMHAHYPLYEYPSAVKTNSHESKGDSPVTFPVEQWNCLLKLARVATLRPSGHRRLCTKKV